MSFISKVLGAIEKQVLRDSAEWTQGDYRTARASNQLTPGDVEVMNLTIIREDGQRAMTLMSHCKTIEVYESVLSPVIFAELNIADAIGMRQDFPINGEEYVKLVIRTPDTRVPTTYMLRVYEVVDEKVVRNAQMRTYKLKCCSPELFRSAKTHISNTYSGTVSEAINDILENYLQTEKSIEIEDTKGAKERVLSRLTPLAAIDYLRRSAISKTHKSSSFVFFENKDGYKFCTLERLLHEGSFLGLTDKTFFFDSGSNNTDINNITMRNIIAFNQVQSAGSLSMIARGGITNVSKQFDLFTGDVTVYNYTDNESADEFKTADEKGAGQRTSTHVMEHGQVGTKAGMSPSVVAAVPSTSETGDSGTAAMMAVRRAYTQKLVDNIVQIYVYGDTDVTVGDVIKCKFPRGLGTSGDPKTTRLDSGNYLVTKVRHMIVLGDRPGHTMSLELIKGSILENP
jgi:hypothetical protein